MKGDQITKGCGLIISALLLVPGLYILIKFTILSYDISYLIFSIPLLSISMVILYSIFYKKRFLPDKMLTITIDRNNKDHQRYFSDPNQIPPAVFAYIVISFIILFIVAAIAEGMYGGNERIVYIIVISTFFILAILGGLIGIVLEMKHKNNNRE